jgi:hypothetical protein
MSSKNRAFLLVGILITGVTQLREKFRSKCAIFLVNFVSPNIIRSRFGAVFGQQITARGRCEFHDEKETGKTE